jgi:CRISPR-associated exonuclease Cas4
MLELLPIALVGVGLAVAAGALRALSRRRRDRRYGALVAVDAGAPATLVSPRYRLTGRPDLLRRASDGRLVPIELKSRPAPTTGPPRSHLVQVWAYCLLVEETQGVPPPHGILRYSDGSEFRVRWDAHARTELLRLRAEIDRPYDGRATPSRAKCPHCGWWAVCDARAA